MTCALNFVFNGREISLPGKSVQCIGCSDLVQGVLACLALPQGYCMTLGKSGQL